MNELCERISDSELEVMKLLWRAEDALSSTEIREELQNTMGWGATTIKTLISRLLGKEVIAQEKRQMFYYRALVSEKEYNSWATGRLINRLYRGSAKNLVAALVDSNGLSPEDIDELRAMFRVED